MVCVCDDCLLGATLTWSFAGPKPFARPRHPYRCPCARPFEVTPKAPVYKFGKQMKFPAQPQKESPSTGDAALSKIQFVFNQQWHGDFLDEVRVTGSLRPLDFRNFRRQQSFRAHCILMVLAKYAWEISPDKEAVTDSEGKLSFSVKSPKDTWIYTLAQFYRRNPNGGMFTQALKKPKFI